jgi:preprotein translocase subunit SecG
MNRLQLVRTTGILLIFLVVLSNIPYSLLIQTFEYDDILRKPVGYVLTRFHAGGTALILTWFTFGLAALLFIPTSILLHKILNREDAPYLTIATFMGAISGILQAVGLMRWVFVVPVLATIYTDKTASTATREAVSVVYQAVHQYGGVVMGEHLGQTLLIGWTLGVVPAMRQSPLFKSWVAWWGLFTTPLLLLGQSELLATVIPAMPVVEATPVGFILWEIWLLIVGISLLRVPQKRLVIQTEQI